jgi:hypothetical protein
MRKLMVILAMAMVLGGAFATSAQAHANFDFFINPPQTGASISYAGGANPLIGEDIIVTGVFVTGAPQNNGSYDIANGILDFTTGNFSSSDPLHWNFAPGGNFDFSGDILNVGGNPSTAIALNGQFTSAIVAQTLPITANHVVIGEYTDIKSDSLLELFGQIGENPWVGALNLSFRTATAIGPGADGSLVDFTSVSVGSGDFTNVPVPPAVWLFGSGLLGLAGLRFRRNRS